MQPAPRHRLDCLLVISDPALLERVREVLAAWHMRAEQLSPVDAIARVQQGECRIIFVEHQPALLVLLDRFRAAGAVSVVVGESSELMPADVECATRPSELLAALFRAQGRLAGLETTSAHQVNSFAQAIAEQFALPELVQVAMTKTRELCEAEGASLLLVEASTGGLYFDTVEGSVKRSIERIRLPRGKGVAGRVALEAKARLVEDVRTCPDFDSSADKQSGFTTGSIVAAPLVLGGSVLGVLMAVRSTAKPPFAPMHLERLVQLTPHVAIAVHNAQITSALRSSQKEVLEANVSLEMKVRERTEQISKAKQEWEKTFDAIDSPIALLEGYVIRRANLAYARAVGLPIREIPSKTCHQLFANRSTPCPGCPISTGKNETRDAQLITADPQTGRATHWRAHGYWLTDDPKGNGVVVTYHDETKTHFLSEKLRESERLAAVGQLASGAAHEINNPLGFLTSNLRSLRGLFDELRAPVSALGEALTLAREGRFDDLKTLLDAQHDIDFENLDDGVEMIDESLDGARRVGEIVKGLRELSRLEIGKREPADVNASVSRVVRSELGESSNVELSLEAQLPADIAPLQLDQVLAHVLRNARQATPRKERISVRTRHTAELVLIEVLDEGVGIAPEHQRRIFEPFFSTRGVGKGIGLGLTAAYGIVKRVGGEIDASSEGPGRGASFIIRLPVAVRSERVSEVAA